MKVQSKIENWFKQNNGAVGRTCYNFSGYTRLNVDKTNKIFIFLFSNLDRTLLCVCWTLNDIHSFCWWNDTIIQQNRPMNYKLAYQDRMWALPRAIHRLATPLCLFVPSTKIQICCVVAPNMQVANSIKYSIYKVYGWFLKHTKFEKVPAMKTCIVLLRPFTHV